MKISICVYDQNDISQNNNIDYQLSIFKNKFISHELQVFKNNAANNIWQNLYLLKWEKRKAEVETRVQFDINIGILSSEIEKINTLPLTEKIQPFTIYFTDGEFKGKTGVNPWCFYGNSLSFDRAAEYYFNRVQDSFNFSENEKFYYYLKTFKLKTKCVNKDNFKII
jgi:hypothetical protein